MGGTAPVTLKHYATAALVSHVQCGSPEALRERSTRQPRPGRQGGVPLPLATAGSVPLVAPRATRVPHSEPVPAQQPQRQRRTGAPSPPRRHSSGAQLQHPRLANRCGDVERLAALLRGPETVLQKS